MPSSDIDNCIESSKKTVAFRDGIKLMYRAFRSPKMFILIPMFMLTGVHTSFWVSIYPTTLTFNSYLAKMIYLPAIYSLGVGLGETISEFPLITSLSPYPYSSGSSDISPFQENQKLWNASHHVHRMLPNLSLLRSYRHDHTFHCSNGSDFREAVVVPANVSGLDGLETQIPVFQPPPSLHDRSDRWDVRLLSLQCPFSNLCPCHANSPWSSLLCIQVLSGWIKLLSPYQYPHHFQSIGTCVIFFISPFLNIYYYTIGIPILCAIASFCFFFETRRIKRMEKTMTNMELDQAQQRKKSSKYETLDEEFWAPLITLSPFERRGFLIQSHHHFIFIWDFDLSLS